MSALYIRGVLKANIKVLTCSKEHSGHPEYTGALGIHCVPCLLALLSALWDQSAAFYDYTHSCSKLSGFSTHTLSWWARCHQMLSLLPPHINTVTQCYDCDLRWKWDKYSLNKKPMDLGWTLYLPLPCFPSLWLGSSCCSWVTPCGHYQFEWKGTQKSWGEAHTCQVFTVLLISMSC